MASVFDRILLNGIRSGQVPARTQKARDWFRSKASKENAIVRKSILNEKSRFKTKVQIGKMYYFVYDAKMKDELPFWDAFPMIFPFRETSKHFYGINLHLAPPKMRAIIMDSLYDLSTNTRYDTTTKLALSYNILMSLSKSNLIKPIVRMYLKSHVRSQFIEVHSTEWDIALWLPVQDIRGASTQKAYAEYRKQI